MDGEGILECRECRQLLFSFWPAAINNGFSFACQSLPPKIGATSKIGATLPIYPQKLVPLYLFTLFSFRTSPIPPTSQTQQLL